MTAPAIIFIIRELIIKLYNHDQLANSTHIDFTYFAWELSEHEQYWLAPKREEHS
ncbi:unknown protein [Desulfotalea psychrophila LSv54]|uniref:Uncharacterized protein n=1 Tax=Desulfotalea psychrophila (strain LSv54 / DSM 12343) TaxID=177439 RepID=Q6APQ7_DESPS|nr:unknown protein [Desulfotalea psychrophila LSv54]